jgi:hypothetical protein
MPLPHCCDTVLKKPGILKMPGFWHLLDHAAFIENTNEKKLTLPRENALK